MRQKWLNELASKKTVIIELNEVSFVEIRKLLIYSSLWACKKSSIEGDFRKRAEGARGLREWCKQ